MIDIIVQRDGGGVVGDDVVDGLMTSSYVALARGECEIDKEANHTIVQLAAIHKPGLRTGQVIDMVDNSTNTIMRGKVVSIEIHLNEVGATIDTVTMRRYS